MESLGEDLHDYRAIERTWTKLVTLDTLHWYCDGPQPTKAAHCYDSQVRRCKSVAFYLRFLLTFSSLSNSHYLSMFMQRWKKVEGGLTSSSKLVQRRKWRGAYLLRRRVRPTSLSKRNCLKKWIVSLRSPS